MQKKHGRECHSARFSLLVVIEAKYTEQLKTLSDFKVFLEQLLDFRPESGSPYQTLMHLSAH